MRGPVNPSMKSDFGVVVAGNELSPMIMMGHTPKRYQQHLLDAGFKTAKRFFAFRFRSKDHAARKNNGIAWQKPKIKSSSDTLRSNFAK